jgi:hypothetical protein
MFSSVLIFLGFSLYDKLHGKSAIAMAAVLGEKGSKWALIGNFFRRSKKKSHESSATNAEDAQKAVVVTDTKKAEKPKTAPLLHHPEIEVEPLRLTMWQVAAVGVLAVVLVNSALNAVVYTYLSTYSDAFGFNGHAPPEVAKKLMEVKEQMHYDMIMGHIPKMSDPEFASKLREIGHELEEEHKVSISPVPSLIHLQPLQTHSHKLIAVVA